MKSRNKVQEEKGEGCYAAHIGAMLFALLDLAAALIPKEPKRKNFFQVTPRGFGIGAAVR